MRQDKYILALIKNPVSIFEPVIDRACVAHRTLCSNHYFITKYNDNGEIIRNDCISYDLADKKKHNIHSEVYTYKDNTVCCDEYTGEITPQSTSFKKSRSIIETYNDHGDMTSYHSDGGDDDEEISYEYDGDKLIKDGLHEYEYDEFGKLINIYNYVDDLNEWYNIEYDSENDVKRINTFRESYSDWNEPARVSLVSTIELVYCYPYSASEERRVARIIYSTVGTPFRDKLVYSVDKIIDIEYGISDKTTSISITKPSEEYGYLRELYYEYDTNMFIVAENELIYDKKSYINRTKPTIHSTLYTTDIYTKFKEI